jgi:hypothetical protein
MMVCTRHYTRHSHWKYIFQSPQKQLKFTERDVLEKVGERKWGVVVEKGFKAKTQ